MRLSVAVGLVIVALGAALWATGAFTGLGLWVAGKQRELQSLLAGEITALRDGETAALWGLLAICAAYGFLHALGPGHGKALIAGAAVGTRATALRMVVIAVLGSLAQALVAILLVYGGLGLLDATARGLAEGSERWIAAAGNLAIALIGAWLLMRGLAALRFRSADAAGQEHGGCGHAHGPTPEAAAQAGPAATLALIAAMAARPCSGAIFVLVIAWRMDLPAAGAMAVIAMGLGTASFTGLVALISVTTREAAFLGAGAGPAARLLAPGLQILAGGLMLALAGLALVASLSI